MKARASDNIPVLKDVLIPGSKAARGQAGREEPARTAPSQATQRQAAKPPTQQTQATQATSEADIASLVDAILAKHMRQMRAELLQEIKALLKENYYGR